MEHARSRDEVWHGGDATSVLFSKGLRRFLFSVMMAVLVVGGVVKIASAQEAAPPASAEAEALDRAARELFTAGMAAVEENRFAAAVDRFQRAYELSERPALLYNVGYAADRARQDSVALTAYREYVRLAPDGEYRGRAEARIAFISELLAEAEPDAVEAEASDSVGQEVVAPPTSHPELNLSQPTPTDLTGAHWLIGIGAFAAAGAGVALALGFVDQQAVENPRPGAPWEEVSESFDRGPTLLTAGFVAGSVGLAAIAAGVIWAVVGESGDTPVSWTPWSVEGSF